MSPVYKFSNVGGFLTKNLYTSALAGNAVVQLDKGSMDPIGVITLASSSANAEFANIPQTYTHLQIRATMICTAVNNMYMQVGNTSIDTGANYSWHQLYGDGASALSNGAGGQSFFYVGYNHSTAQPNVSVIDILDYRNTNKHKTARIFAGTETNSTNGYSIFMSGRWASSSAINTLRITPGSGNFNTNTTFALYGINA